MPIVPAAHEAFAVLASDNERSLFQGRNYKHTIGVVPQLLRDIFVGRRVNLADDGRRLLNSVLLFGRDICFEQRGAGRQRADE